MSEFEPEPEYDDDYLHKKLDVWQIIDTYFRDNPNYKSQHQIDSHIMNLFIVKRMVLNILLNVKIHK